MSLRRNCLLWQCTRAVLQALPLVEAVEAARATAAAAVAAAEAGAEKVREGKERAQQRSAFREHDFDGGADGDGGSTPRLAASRETCARALVAVALRASFSNSLHSS